MIFQGENKADYIAAEGELSTLLSNFSTDYIYNSIEDLIIERNNNFNLQPKSNFVSALESSFKSMLTAYPADKQNILQVRDTTYKEILDRVCIGCGVSITYDMGNTDMYSLAKYIYDLFIAKYDISVFTFFHRFITLQKDYIYSALQLDSRKKSKDTSTIYNKNTYEDPKLAIIIANLEYCLNFINNLDFDPYQTLSYIYYTDEDKNIMAFLLNYIDPNNNLYDILIGNVFKTPLLYNPCFANLRLLGSIQDVIPNNGIYSPEF